MRGDMNSVQPNLDALPGDEAPRIRVRTPGKHIVLFALAVAFMTVISAMAVRPGGVALPSHEHKGFGASDGTLLFAPPEEFLIDLGPDATGRTALLRLKTKLVAKDRAALGEIEEKQPMIRERVSFFLRELSADDFAGSEAMARMKTELLKRASLSLSDGAATDIIIEDIVIQ